MPDAMVTGRMSEQKKAQGACILQSNGLTASQAINMMYDKLIAEQGVSFLKSDARKKPTKAELEAAARFVDSIPIKRKTRFDNMTAKEAKMERLRSRGYFE